MSFARALFTVSGFTLISRIAGFIRDALMATFLGAGMAADAFFVAQRLPNLFRSLFAEGAFSAAFVPLYTAEKEKNGDAAAQRFAAQALAILIAALTPFTILMMALMPLVIRVIAPGFHDEPLKFDLAVRYSCITFPYLLLISITALQSGALNAHGRFAPGAIAPILLNIVMIVTLLLTSLFAWDVAEALTWAMLVSGFVQAGYLALSCRRAGVHIPLIVPHLSAASRQLFRNITPAAVGAGATQINLLMTTILASLLPTGAVSYLYYADRLNQLPLGIIGIAVATTLLPILSKHETNGDAGAIKTTVSRAVEFCLLMGLPAAFGLGLAAQPIIQTLFEHGAFSATDTHETARTLAAYSLCIPAFLLAKIFTARFFARQDTKTPVRIAIACMIANVALAALLMQRFEHVGMALGTSLATWLNVALLYGTLRRSGEALFDETVRKRLPRIALAAFGMAAATAALCAQTAFLFENTPLLSKIFGLTLILGLSLAAYAVLLSLFGAVNWRELLSHLKRADDTKRHDDV